MTQTKNTSTVTDLEVQAWIDTYYVKLPANALHDLSKFLHPELNIASWAEHHYLTLAPDARDALAALLQGRTGSLVASICGNGSGPSLPDLGSAAECPICLERRTEVLDLRRRLSEVQDRNSQLESAYIGLSTKIPSDHDTTTAPEADVDVGYADSARAETDPGLSSLQEKFSAPRAGKSQNGKLRMKNHQHR